MVFKNDREHRYRFICCFKMQVILFMVAGCLAGPVQCKEIFKTQSFNLPDRTLALISADLDDSGPSEIVVIRKTGEYPSEQRWISIFHADDNLNYGPIPRQQWRVDQDATMFEVGDVARSPGKEIFFLTANGIRYYARQDDGLYSTSSLILLNRPTATVFPSPGFLPRTKVLSDWQGNGQKMILIPQFDGFVFFSQNLAGEWRAARKNSTVPRTFLYSDQEDDGILRSFSMRMDYRLPRLFTDDFNGDGFVDLLLTEQESIFVYPYIAEGYFSQEPAAVITLPGRPSGKETDWDLSFLAIPTDLNNDGFTDVILTLGQNTGSFLERKVEVFIFLNQKSSKIPFASQPDQTIAFYGITPGVCVTDINKDGFKDLLFSNIELGFWNIVKNLISKQVNVYTSAYIFQNDQRFKKDPDFSNKTKYHLKLTQGVHFNGLWPSTEGDFNGDGYPDLLIATDGRIKIYQTRQGKPLFSESHRQEGVVTCSFRQITDINRDGLDDIIMYEKKRNAKVSILVNKGNWPEHLSKRNQTNVKDR